MNQVEVLLFRFPPPPPPLQIPPPSLTALDEMLSHPFFQEPCSDKVSVIQKDTCVTVNSVP